MKRSSLILLTLTLIGIGSYFWQQRSVTDNNSSESVTTIQKSNTGLTTELKLQKKTPTNQVTTTDQSSSTDDNTQPEDQRSKVFTEIKKCYPNIEMRSHYPIADAFEQLSQGKNYIDEIDFHNYHYTLPNGEERRLQIRRDEDPQGNIHKELKLFKLDSEGLPEPIPLPKKQARNPSEETIEELISQGSLHFTQEIGNRIFENDNYISFVKENGELQNMEVYIDGKVLRCSIDNQENEYCKCSN